MILFKIAFRNLREHKSKTLIIGTLVALGVATLVIGNSVIETITRGMEASYVDNFTGDLIVRNVSEEEVSFVGGFGSAPETLEHYPDITSYLENDKAVKAYTPLLTGQATINQQNKELAFTLLWGTEPSSYYKMFPGSFTVTAGEKLRDRQEGIVLSQEMVDTVRKEGVTLKVGDTILLSGQNNVTGTKIREVTIRGIGHFENDGGLLEFISFVDVNTLRVLTGLTAARPGVTGEGSGTTPDLNEDSLFGGGDTFVSDAAENTKGNSATDFDNILGDTSVRDQYLALDNDAWHYLLVDVDDSTPLMTLSQQLEKSPVGENLVVEGWRWGAGVIAELAFGVRAVLNIIIAVVAVVAVIIIMNTLVISVTERIAEIGTVRALGGQKNFVRGMIITEVLLITFVFGWVGMAVGSAVIGVLNLVGLSTPNLFLQVLFGGSVLKPVLSISSLFISVVAVAVIGVMASLYPVSVALGITPVKAMQSR